VTAVTAVTAGGPLRLGFSVRVPAVAVAMAVARGVARTFRGGHR
jgi:hypothetical protein